MGRHVNHQDEQDRLILKNTKIVSHRNKSLDERDPGSLTIAEQEIIVRKRLSDKIKNAPLPVTAKLRFTGRQINQP